MADINKPDDRDIKYHATCETEAMNIRTGPSTASRIVSKAPTKVTKGQTIDVYDIDSNDWMKHWHDRLNCYVYTRKTNNGKSMFSIKTTDKLATVSSEIFNAISGNTTTTSKEVEEENNKKMSELNKQPSTVMGTGIVHVTYIPYRTSPSDTGATMSSKGLQPDVAPYGDEITFYDSILLSNDDIFVRGPNANATTPTWLKAFDGRTKTEWIQLRYNLKLTTRKITASELESYGGDKSQATITEEEEKKQKELDALITSRSTIGKGTVVKSANYLLTPSSTTSSDKSTLSPSMTTTGDIVDIYSVGKYNNGTYIEVLHQSKKFVWLLANSNPINVINGSNVISSKGEIYVKCEYNDLKDIKTLTYEQVTIDPNETSKELTDEEKKKKEEYIKKSTSIGTAYVIGESVNYRTQPSMVCTSYESKGIKPYIAIYHSTIPFYEIVSGSDNCTYVKVVHPSGDFAWLMAYKKATTLSSLFVGSEKVEISEERYLQLTTEGEIEIKRITIDEVIDKETTSEKPIEVIESEAKDAQGNLVSLTSIGYAVVTDVVSYLNFRTNPSTTAKTYEQRGIKRYYATAGERYEIYGISDDGNWIKVIHPDTNNIAWLANKRLILNGNKEATYLDITLYNIEKTDADINKEVPIIDKGTTPEKLDIRNDDERKAAEDYYNNLFDDNWYEYLGGQKSKNSSDKLIASDHNFVSVSKNNLDKLISKFNSESNVDDDYVTTREVDFDWKTALNHNAPSIVQNDMNFPVIDSVNNGVYRYNYAQNYYEGSTKGGLGITASTETKDSTFDLMLQNLRKALDIPSMDSYHDTYSKQLHMYNRFKLPTSNDQLAKSFSHVFFTKPDLNIFGKNGVMDNATGGVDSFINNIYKMTPTLFSQLTLDNVDGIDQEAGTRFMMYLSNKAASIDISDESLEVAEYGQTHTGFKLIYGKNTLKAKQAGDITISFTDDRRLTIYKIIRVWLDYISGCYRGLYLPKDEYIYYHALDYASSIYYILCAEDGETIIYWAKYYGTFPVNVPSSQYSKAEGNNINTPKGNYTFKYTIKEEMTPMIIHEFNSCTAPIQTKYGSVYTKTYNPDILTGGTWVGAPFITLEYDSAGSYIYKLRFRPYDTTGYK